MTFYFILFYFYFFSLLSHYSKIVLHEETVLSPQVQYILVSPPFTHILHCFVKVQNWMLQKDDIICHTSKAQEKLESYFDPITVSNTIIFICLLDKCFECKNVYLEKCNDNNWTIFTSKFELHQLINFISEVADKEPHAPTGQQVSLKSFFFFN